MCMSRDILYMKQRQQKGHLWGIFLDFVIFDRRSWSILTYISYNPEYHARSGHHPRVTSWRNKTKCKTYFAIVDRVAHDADAWLSFIIHHTTRIMHKFEFAVLAWLTRKVYSKQFWLKFTFGHATPSCFEFMWPPCVPWSETVMLTYFAW